MNSSFRSSSLIIDVQYCFRVSIVLTNIKNLLHGPLYSSDWFKISFFSACASHSATLPLVQYPSTKDKHCCHLYVTHTNIHKHSLWNFVYLQMFCFIFLDQLDWPCLIVMATGKGKLAVSPGVSCQRDWLTLTVII